MNDKIQLKVKIKEWLDDEGFLVSEKDEEISDFHLVISNLYGQGTFADIVKPKNKNFIILGSAIQTPPEFLRLFSSIDVQERSNFFSQVQRELLKFKVDHELHPNKLMPERMIIRDTVYVEDLTQNILMACLKSVKFASLFLLWSIGHKFSPEVHSSSPAHSTTSDDSRSPYG